MHASWAVTTKLCLEAAPGTLLYTWCWRLALLHSPRLRHEKNTDVCRVDVIEEDVAEVLTAPEAANDIVTDAADGDIASNDSPGDVGVRYCGYYYCHQVFVFSFLDPHYCFPALNS